MTGQDPELVVESYDIQVDLEEPEAEHFRSRAVIKFSIGARTSATAELAAASVEAVTLNGRYLDMAEVWHGDRLELTGLDEANVLEVEGLFRYAADGRGVGRVHDAGRAYIYCAAHPAAAARVFCCFGGPGRRAHTSLALSVPREWSCPVVDQTRPLGPSVVAWAAGPWAELHQLVVQSAGGSPIPVAVYGHRSRAGAQIKGREIAELLGRSIAFYERHLGVPYPYRKCDAVFVRNFVSLGLSTPGLIMFNDAVLDLIDDRGPQYAATVISHEVAHAWIGNLVDFGEAQWLVEAGATYLSRLAVVDLVRGSRPWTVTDPAPPDAGQYAADAGLIRSLEHTIGREILLRGLGACCVRFAHRSAEPGDLAQCWSELSRHDVSSWATNRRMLPSGLST